MCKLFIDADSSLWTSQTKSLRIDGVVTSIRLEHFFWDTLKEIAYRDDMTVNSLITKLYFESIDAEHDLGNFTSFLRVCCARYHALIVSGDLSKSLEHDLRSINANEILHQEKKRYAARQLRFAD